MKYFNQFIKKLTPPRVIALYYLGAMIISIALLYLPYVLKEGVEYSFIDMAFTAVSAVSVTGLTVFDISEAFTIFGLIILLIIMQIGGIGIMAIGTFIWLLLGKKIGLRSKRLIMADSNQYHMHELKSLIKHIIIIMLGVELIGTIILTIRLLPYYNSITQTIFNGLFLAVSATTNSGFVMDSNTIFILRDDLFVQFFVIVLIILGAIGFPVLRELKYYFRSKFESVRIPFRFSLFSKLTTVTYFALLLVGMLMIILLERNASLSHLSLGEGMLNALFQSTTSRSAGLFTYDINLYSEPTLLLLCFLMFIGASPSSVGGGIRTTTFALTILFVYHFAQSKKNIRIFNRELYDEDLMKSLAITIMAFFLCISGVFLLKLSNGQFTLMEILFEVCSAFGTTGLSMGITSELNTFGKSVLMILMFIGRIGLTSFLFILTRKEKETNYSYPKEKVIIG